MLLNSFPFRLVVPVGVRVVLECATQYAAPGTCYPEPGTHYKVSGSSHLKPGTWHQIPGSRHVVPGIGNVVLGSLESGAISLCTSCKLPGTWYQASGILSHAPTPAMGYQKPV